ncbi:MarR family transcriptional regulator [Facklamia sp. P12945]|uniref:MarR family transcriptional regulator n=1 Tax=unclassified Facklamia TaxID=2622293 RepID=UPI003D1834AE
MEATPANDLYGIFGAKEINSTQKLVMIYIYLKAEGASRVSITNTDFIKALNFDYSTLNRALNALEANGFIKREISENENGQTTREIEIFI